MAHPVSPDLPSPLRAAMEQALTGLVRKDLGARAGAISQAYRSGQGSDRAIGGAADALAYAMARMPATYAACAAVFTEAQARAPGFTPLRLLDAGAGPGTASWAALAAWPEIETACLADASPPFLKLARELSAEAEGSLGRAEFRRLDLTRAPELPSADLVVSSYALAEVAEAAQPAVVEALWSACDGMLALIEPGTPAGFERLRRARQALIDAGAQILAPCPHARACPVAAPDWCHFVQRLPRSRDHRLAKGAEAPFEDEKFAYLLAARPQVLAEPAAARVLAPPRAGKPGIELRLCTPAGLERRFVARRDKAAHALARRLDWGDALDRD